MQLSSGDSAIAIASAAGEQILRSVALKSDAERLDYVMRIQRKRFLSGCGLCIAICAATLAGCDSPRHVFLERHRVVERTARISRPVSRATLPRPPRAQPRAVERTARISRPVSRATLPLPPRAQLSAPVEPDCKLNDPNADERQKLDYERQCYRHAEMIVRERLLLLQSWVGRMVRVANHPE
jgi:hypothetical protein